VGKYPSENPADVSAEYYHPLMPQNGIHLDGSKVANWRKTMFLSQEDFARRVDLHPNTIIKIESDPSYRTSFKTARRIAKAFKIDPGSLLRDDPEEAAV
jgi:DNA-binding XRE family transcriptional regulator